MGASLEKALLSHPVLCVVRCLVFRGRDRRLSHSYYSSDAGAGNNIDYIVQYILDGEIYGLTASATRM